MIFVFDVFFDSLVHIGSSPALIGLSLTSVLIGIILGALPGVSSTMALAILLPFSYAMPPESAIIFLIGIFSARVFGGSISAILINIPGTPGAIVTQFDGYPMAKKGQAARAFGAAFTVSAFGGVFGALILAASVPLILPIIVAFTSPELFMLGVPGLYMVGALSGRSIMKGLAVAAFGLLISTVGYA